MSGYKTADEIANEVSNTTHLPLPQAPLPPNVARFPDVGKNAQQDGKLRLTLTPLRDIQMRSIEWLEKPMWQRLAFQLLAAPKGAGKGTYLASLAARTSKRGEHVVFIASSEDSVSIDLKPRLVAAGADMDYCWIVQQHVRLPEDIDALKTLVRDVCGDAPIGLLVIDPIAGHIGGSNSDREGEVRHAIQPLNKLADELGCLVIGVGI